MPCYLYKLRFNGPLHLGSDRPGIQLEKVMPTCRADTFFSALCIEGGMLYGESFIERLVASAINGQFLISDLFPYFNKDKYCLPKPALNPGKAKVNPEKKHREDDDSINKKQMKKMAFIPVDLWDTYLQTLKTDNNDKIKQMPLDWQEVFNQQIRPAVTTRVKVSRDFADGKPGEPYSVGAYVFDEKAGLYFMVKLDGNDKNTSNNVTKDEFDNLIKSLGLSGIGGKRTSGYGRFDKVTNKKESCQDLINVFKKKDHVDYHMALSVTSPLMGENSELTDQLLEKSYYTLIPRQGFVNSPGYSQGPVKRKPVVMFGAGSCFCQKLEGNVLDVSDNGGHKVYRYGKAMMIGVKI